MIKVRHALRANIHRQTEAGFLETGKETGRKSKGYTVESRQGEDRTAFAVGEVGLVPQTITGSTLHQLQPQTYSANNATTNTIVFNKQRSYKHSSIQQTTMQTGSAQRRRGAH